MNRTAPWLCAVALLLLASSLAVAQTPVKDPADLLPAQTLACVEFRHPDKLAREMGLLIKGSALEDMPATMAKFRANMPQQDYFYGAYEIGTMAMFVSPEMLNEFSRFQGGMLALTGVSKNKGPQWVGVLLSGDSNFPGLYMRAALTFSDSFRGAGEIEGVTIYQERRRIYEAIPPQQPGAPPVRQQPREEAGMAMAMMPGVLIFGDSPDRIKDVIRRSKGKSNDPALSSMRAFKDTAKLRERPGLFAYADMEALAGQLDDAAKTLRPQDKAQWEMFKTVVNPRAFRAATASLTIDNGNVELHATVKTVTGQTSPLLDLLPDKKADAQLLQFVPRDSVATLNLGLGDGEKRWTKIVELLDALAKTQGESDLNLPSKKIKEAEDTYKLKIGKDVLTKITGVSVSTTLDVRGEPLPLIVLSATDADAAKFLEETALPKLAAILTGLASSPEVKREEIQGMRVSSMPLKGMLPGEGQLHFGRQGNTLVLGIQKPRVALALSAGAKKEGLGSDAKYVAALKEADGSVTVGVASVGAAIVQLLKSQESMGIPRFKEVRPVPGDPAKPVPPPEIKLSDRAVKAIKELTKIVEPLPPVVFSLTRKEDSIVLDARQMGLRTISTKVIDLWIDAALQRAVERSGRNFAVPDAPPQAKPADQPGAKIERIREAEAEARDREEAARQAAEEAKREVEAIRQKLEEQRRKEKEK